MKIADIVNFKSRCSRMRFIPCDLLDNGKLRFRATYKNKGGQITLATFLCDTDTGHVDEIHFAKRDCNTMDRVMKAIAICLNEGEWEIDNNTFQHWLIRKQIFNKETHKFEKIHLLERAFIYE